VNHYITDIDEWAEACVSNPRWLAESLQRIGRFGGQHPTSNVLLHSLQVWWELRGLDPWIELWGLLHDAHEVLSGDITKGWKTISVDQRQMFADLALKRACGVYPLACSLVWRVDKEQGDREFYEWGDFVFAHDPSMAVEIFTRETTRLLAVVKSLEG